MEIYKRKEEEKNLVHRRTCILEKHKKKTQRKTIKRYYLYTDSDGHDAGAFVISILYFSTTGVQYH